LFKLKRVISAIFITAILVALASPALAVNYNPGVTVGQYVKYGHFSASGIGFESFNDYDFLKLQVTSVSGKEVSLLSTGQFKNGTALPGNGTSAVLNIETGTQDGTPSTQGPIIAANLNLGDAIPPPNTYLVNATEDRPYLGVSRTVNILNVTVSTPDYNSTLSYIYDKTTGFLLESSTQTTTQSEPEPVTSAYSYSVIETNIFGSSAGGGFPVLILILPIIAVIIIVVVILLLRLKKH
jgi:hypothetical protein